MTCTGVADVRAFHQKYDLLGEVRGVISDPLEDLRGTLNVNAAVDPSVLAHSLQLVGEHSSECIVHGVVESDDVAGCGGVAVHKRVDRSRNHNAHITRHLQDARVKGSSVQPGEVARALGHVHGKVPDSFDIRNHFEPLGHESQVGLREFMGGQQLQAQLVDGDLRLVDPSVFADDPSDGLRVASFEGLRRHPDHLFDMAGHREEALA